MPNTTNTWKLNCVGASLSTGGFSRCNYPWITNRLRICNFTAIVHAMYLSPHMNLNLHLIIDSGNLYTILSIPRDGTPCDNHSTHVPLKLGYVMIIQLQTMINIIHIITFKTRFSFNMTLDRPSCITSIMKLKSQCVMTQFAFKHSHFQKTSTSRNTD